MVWRVRDIVVDDEAVIILFNILSFRNEQLCWRKVIFANDSNICVMVAVMLLRIGALKKIILLSGALHLVQMNGTCIFANFKGNYHSSVFKWETEGATGHLGGIIIKLVIA